MKTRTHRLESRITEDLDGVRADASPGSRPRREYDVTARSMCQRLLAKQEELKALVQGLSLIPLKCPISAYETEGIQDLVDQRLIRRSAMGGQIDQRVIDDLQVEQRLNIVRSSRSTDRIRRDVVQRVRVDYGDEMPFPYRASTESRFGGI